MTKTTFAKHSGISRTHLYYQPKQPEKDWRIKQRIESALREHPSYGSRRLSLALGINRKSAQRVMRIFGIKPYRRRGRKYRKTSNNATSFPNMLLTEYPFYPHRIWASDFTHLSFHGKTVYLATIIDLFTRTVAGFSVLTTHSVQLVTQALLSAVHKHPAPAILHSDHGSEYTSKDYIQICRNLGIAISMSRKGAPWENGYQESFYSQFKVDLGDPNRFKTLGELVYEIYRTIHMYNNQRIHSKLKMPPAIFAERFQRSNRIVESLS